MGRGGETMKHSHVWIIEMLVNDKWEPTIGCGISKEDALMFMRAEWKSNNPNDKFRIAKYNRDWR